MASWLRGLIPWSLPAWLEAFDRVENDADEDEAAKQHDH